MTSAIPSLSFCVQLSLVAALGLLLRLYRLDWQSAWIDELFTMQVSSMDFELLLREMSLDYAHPPLHMLVAKWVTNLIGYGVWQVRLFSAVCGTAEIFVMGLLAAKLFGQRVAILSALLLAVAQAKIYESQEARGYALAALLVTLASYWLLSALQEGRALDWWKFVGASGLMLNVHYYTVFVLLAMVVFAFWFRREYPVPRWWWAGGLLVLACFMLPWLSSGVVGEFLRSWEPSSFPGMSRAKAITPLLILNWYNSGKWNGATFPSPLWTVPIGVLLFTAPAAWGLLQIRHPSREGQRVLFIAVLWLIPMLTICLGSWAVGLIFEARYVMLALAPYLVLVAYGVDRLREDLRRVLIPLILLYSLAALHANYFVETKADYRGVVSHIASMEGEGLCLVSREKPSPVDHGVAAWSVYSGRPALRRRILDRAALEGATCSTLVMVRDSYHTWRPLPPELETIAAIHWVRTTKEFRGVSVLVFRKRPKDQQIVR